ncbi:unnamed protein product [Anisakis simplex]|uniref:Uncharacterized protein n=1 Tax=Anisakis simplex TaxID=6269 RepID=A0A3P6Q1C7_ANISI|nr:unnamed protein product [Anisakis simplex]
MLIKYGPSINFTTAAAFSDSNTNSQYFLCPSRCQCYTDPVDNTKSMHLICKWEHLNSSAYLETIRALDPIRTLTIRCPHGSRTVSQPSVHLFRHLKNLDRLEIDRCQIESLPNDLFKGMTQLYSLIIRSASLEDLPRDIFADLKNLMTLDLTNNNLHIEPYALSVLTSLRRLDLSGNQLDFISGVGTVNILPASLWSIDLTSNRLRYIQDGAFANMLKLTMLDLRNNSLTELREASVSANERKHRLRVMLSGNPLECVCSLRWIVHAATKTSPMVLDLTDLYCSHLLSHHNHTLLLLTDADRHGDLLCKYESSCAEQCACCFHQHSCFCRSVCPIGCTCWHSAAPHVNRMGKNIVECNNVRLDRLSEIPESVTELRFLNSHWKQWSPGDIGPRRFLRILNVTNCNLRSLGKNFLDGFPRLRQLDLSSNHIQTFPYTQLDAVADLEKLFLSDNELTEFSEQALKRFDSIANLKFGGTTNKFKCDCTHPSALQKWLFGAKEFTRICPFSSKKHQHHNETNNEKTASSTTQIKDIATHSTKSAESHEQLSEASAVTKTTTFLPLTIPVRVTTTKRRRILATAVASKAHLSNTGSGNRVSSSSDASDYVEDSFIDMNFLFSYIMFFLVLLLVCLLFTIGATIYFRYCYMEKRSKHYFHKESTMVNTSLASSTSKQHHSHAQQPQQQQQQLQKQSMDEFSSEQRQPLSNGLQLIIVLL